MIKAISEIIPAFFIAALLSVAPLIIKISGMINTMGIYKYFVVAHINKEIISPANL